jgi:RNAse (barnase) inhibitor barstar
MLNCIILFVLWDVLVSKAKVDKPLEIEVDARNSGANSLQNMAASDCKS